MSSAIARSSSSEESFSSVITTTRSHLNAAELADDLVDTALDSVDVADDLVDTFVDSVDLTEDVLDCVDVPLCRICWSDESIDELITLPCKCQGTVGKVHADCLKEWERVRKTRRCEICKEFYMKKRDLMAVLRSFFQYQYAGILFCKISNITATALIAYANIVLGEMNISYLNETIKGSSDRNGLSYPVILLSAAIFPYFVINYFAVDFIMSEMIDCYHIIRDWWTNER